MTKGNSNAVCDIVSMSQFVSCELPFSSTFLGIQGAMLHAKGKQFYRCMSSCITHLHTSTYP